MKRILISVTNKTGLELFKKFPTDEWSILSTGGTAKCLEEHNIPYTLIEEVTGFPEMLDGRVKTLHPKIFAGILAQRSKPEHMEKIREFGIDTIDLVVVNLYDFQKKKCIENVDIGGPSLIRAAAKNGIPVICDPDDYELYLPTLIRDGKINPEAIQYLAYRALNYTANYDTLITMWMKDCIGKQISIYKD